MGAASADEVRDVFEPTNAKLGADTSPGIAANGKPMAPATAGSVIGRGMDITKNYADASQFKKPALNYEFLNSLGEVKDYPDIVQGTQIEVIVGNTASEYSEALSEKIGVQAEAEYGSYVKFSGEFNYAKNGTSTAKANQMYTTARLNMPTRVIELDMTLPALVGKYGDKALSEGFAYDKEHMSPANLVTYYGTHIMIGGEWGVRLDYNMSAKTNSSADSEKVAYAIKAKLSGGYGAFSASASASYELEQQINSSLDTSTKTQTIVVYGGGQKQRAQFGVDAFFDQIKDKTVEEWAASVSDGNDVWTNYHGYPSLVPITELIVDPAQKQKVQDFIRDYVNHDGLAWDGATVEFDINGNGLAETEIDNNSIETFYREGGYSQPTGDLNYDITFSFEKVEQETSAASDKAGSDKTFIIPKATIEYSFTAPNGTWFKDNGNPHPLGYGAFFWVDKIFGPTMPATGTEFYTSTNQARTLIRTDRFAESVIKVPSTFNGTLKAPKNIKVKGTIANFQNYAGSYYEISTSEFIKLKIYIPDIAGGSVKAIIRKPSSMPENLWYWSSSPGKPIYFDGGGEVSVKNVTPTKLTTKPPIFKTVLAAD